MNASITVEPYVWRIAISVAGREGISPRALIRRWLSHAALMHSLKVGSTRAAPVVTMRHMESSIP